MTAQPQRSERWIEACDAGEIEPEDVIRFDHQGREYAIYRSPSDEYFATDGICTHEHAYMSDGYVDGCIIECPLHQATFDVRTGKVLAGPATVDLPAFPVKVVGDSVFVNLCGAKPCAG